MVLWFIVSSFIVTIRLPLVGNVSVKYSTITSHLSTAGRNKGLISSVSVGAIPEVGTVMTFQKRGFVISARPSRGLLSHPGEYFMRNYRGIAHFHQGIFVVIIDHMSVSLLWRILS